jgi:DNA repair exonuclease SbcCD ATPase subunit
MHIKQITISNFRSFRQQPEIHPFAATTNCVVGRNGSGKSNLFDAVQFVLLSPRFATLRSVRRLEDRTEVAIVLVFVLLPFSFILTICTFELCRKNVNLCCTKAVEVPL